MLGSNSSGRPRMIAKLIRLIKRAAGYHPGWLSFLALCLGGSLLLGALARGGRLMAPDLAGARLAQTHVASWLVWIAFGLSLLEFVIPLAALGLAGALLRIRLLREAVFVLAAALSGFVGPQLMKHLLHVPCLPAQEAPVLAPLDVFTATGTSAVVGTLDTRMDCYPSGHAVLFMSFCGFLIYLCAHQLVPAVHSQPWRASAIGALLGLIVLIGPARVYLGLHAVSEVVGGYLLGLAILSGLVVSYQEKRLVLRVRWPPRRPHPIEAPTLPVRRQ